MKTIQILSLILITMIASTNINAQSKSANRKVLIAYYSHSGNTRAVANQIKTATGGDIFEIQPAQDYPSEYQTLVDQAKKEIDSGYKPTIKSQVKDITSYDIIFIGSPCWWSTIAPPAATFLSDYDLSGKTIVPFMTHEGSRMGHSVSDIKKLCPKSTVLEGLPIRGGSVKNSQKEVSIWIQKIGINK